MLILSTKGGIPPLPFFIQTSIVIHYLTLNTYYICTTTLPFCQPHFMILVVFATPYIIIMMKSSFLLMPVGAVTRYSLTQPCLMSRSSISLRIVFITIFLSALQSGDTRYFFGASPVMR